MITNAILFIGCVSTPKETRTKDMAEIIKFNDEPVKNNQELMENNVADVTNALLNEVSPDFSNNKTYTVPISGLALLGTGISALRKMRSLERQAISYIPTTISSFSEHTIRIPQR